VQTSLIEFKKMLINKEFFKNNCQTQEKDRVVVQTSLIEFKKMLINKEFFKNNCQTQEKH
jgi:hypothetical protein